ncbi:STAS domain-containing protein [Plantactinospora sp. GCM10030261]|uniref:STAS domain-containing protein n=1 Tax=Plantactinospora sp. GCM10030261 TaxID=3273420 RepID=UPI0036174500
MQRDDGPATPLRLTADTSEPTCPVVLVGGDLDFQTSGGLWVELERLIETGPGRLVIDTTALRFVDSTGLSVIVRAWRACQEAGILLTLRGVPAFLENILRITGVAELLARQPAPPDGLDANRVPAG